MLTPSAQASRTAEPTVFGMSWYFRSRNTRRPDAIRSRTTCGPSAVKSCFPTLNVETESPRAATMRRASAARETSSATINLSRVAYWFMLYSLPQRSKFSGSSRRAGGGHGFWFNDIQPDLLHSSGTHFQHLRGAIGEVNDASGRNRSAVVHANDHPQIVLKVGDLHVRAQRQLHMCCRELEHIVRFAGCGRLSMKALPVPRSLADLIRLVGLPPMTDKGCFSVLRVAGPFRCSDGNGQQQGRHRRR